MSHSTLRRHLTDHPRLLGLLFVLWLLAMQAQPVAAGATYIHGP